MRPYSFWWNSTAFPLIGSPHKNWLCEVFSHVLIYYPLWSCRGICLKWKSDILQICFELFSSSPLPSKKSSKLACFPGLSFPFLPHLSPPFPQPLAKTSLLLPFLMLLLVPRTFLVLCIPQLLPGHPTLLQAARSGLGDPSCALIEFNCIECEVLFPLECLPLRFYVFKSKICSINLCITLILWQCLIIIGFEHLINEWTIEWTLVGVQEWRIIKILLCGLG